MATILHTLLDAATLTGPGAAVDIENTQYKMHTAIVTAFGTNPVAQVDIEISHDQISWAPAGSVTLNGAGTKQVTFEASARYLRANLVSLTGPPNGEVTAKISSG